MKEHQDQSLALGKKRRNNRLEENLMVLRGEIDAAINASKCQEGMFRDHGAVPNEIYEQAIQDCDFVEPGIRAFSETIKSYRSRVDQVRKFLAAD